MRVGFIGLLALALTAAPAGAAVTYKFSLTGSAVGFTYVSPTYISDNAFIPPADLAACTSPIDATCAAQEFVTSNPDYEFVKFRFQKAGSGCCDEIFSYFEKGAFAAPGTYASILVVNPAVLIVEERRSIDIVPEPSSWALLIAGFGLVGAVMRRRRLRVA